MKNKNKNLKRRGQTVLEYVILCAVLAGASTFLSFVLFGNGSSDPAEVGVVGKALAEYKKQFDHRSTGAANEGLQKYGGRTSWGAYYGRSVATPLPNGAISAK